MKYIGIIAEYNPFHNGHKYQADKVREIFPESAIIAVMSGNVTQRGEIALMPKELRAKAAVTSGIDLVLELPAIYSQSSAEIFARGGVSILNRLNIIDFLCFGSETGDANLLKTVSERMMSRELEETLRFNIRLQENKNLSYPSQILKAYRELYGENGIEILTGSNDILALEYMKALRTQKSTITPLPIKRIGGTYNSEAYDGTSVSATSIRNIIGQGGMDIGDLLPEQSYNIIKEAAKKNLFFDRNVFDFIIISNLKRICHDISIEKLLEYPDFNKGMAFKFIACVKAADSVEELIKEFGAKTHSQSKIKRMILYVLFGIKREATQSLPSYTKLLGANETGLAVLNQIKKTSGIKIITKASAIDDEQLKRNIFIDSMCELAVRGKESLKIAKQKPFIMKK